MFQNVNIVKVVSVGASILIGIVALLIFSGKMPGFSNTSKANTNKATLIVWGTVPRDYIDKTILAVTQATGKPFQFTYEEFTKDSLSSSLTQADATGRAPDLILTDSEVINQSASMLYIVPYTYMDELTYKNTYIDAASPYTTPVGVTMYPVAADPLVTFYNKKIFRENGITNPPKNWLELPGYAEKLTVNPDSTIPTQSAFGLGANNVLNNKQILVANLMQTGHNPARVINLLTNSFSVDLGASSVTGGEGDIYKILRFQTAFSDVQKTVYTWNETDNTDLQKFISGKSAMYFGHASDYYKILSSSPNLEMGIYFLPQLSDKYNVTTGDLIGVSVSKSTKDLPYAVQTAQQIAGITFSSVLSQMLGSSSARKDVLAGNDGSERSTIVGSGALTMQLFYNLNFSYTDKLFYQLYDDILSGRKSVEKAVESFSINFSKLYNKQ